jgi:UDP-N-acetylglucosamine 2-epimerase
MIELLPYEEYLTTVYNSKFIISDSGTGQEEPALLGTQVVVPRDFTERPQSYENNCSVKLCVGDGKTNFDEVFTWLESNKKMGTEWLGNGNTSKEIIGHILDFFA